MSAGGALKFLLEPVVDATIMKHVTAAKQLYLAARLHRIQTDTAHFFLVFSH